MLAAYIITGIIGIGLILVSVFTGHGDHDHEIGGHVDHDHGFDSWIPFFSLRFWTYTLGVFGLTGVSLTYLSSSKEPTTAMMSAGTGVVVGLAVTWAMQALKKADTSSVTGEKGLVGKTGLLLVGVRSGQDGKVRIQTGDETIDLIARGYDGEELPHGAPVVVVALVGDRALVMGQAALEE